MDNSIEIEKINLLKKQKFNWRILWENFVFKHGDNYYKMPSFIWKTFFYKENDSYNQAKINFKLINNYFWKVIKIADTQIAKNSDWHYVIKQKELKWHILTKKDLEKNYLLLSKFKKLVIINEIMWEKENVFLDLLWSDFAFAPNKIHNLITDWKELYIFDFWLFHKKSKNILSKIFSNISTKIQIFIIKIFWNK